LIFLHRLTYIFISIKEIEENPYAEPSKPAEIATVPQWLVVAKNRRVNRDWELLLSRAPENASRCYEDLSTTPMTPETWARFSVERQTL
jgi:hypothetical protein